MAKKEKKPLTQEQLIKRKKAYEIFSTIMLTFMSLCYPLVGFIALFLFRNDENKVKRTLILIATLISFGMNVYQIIKEGA
ncbi:MAG: hypothetical protein IKX97_05600 [Erysipelotrichaceae bacterium]|nr:hypothetical protein [Erysipelotrichaceae bacterium]MBR5755275.1 hypothetical protein [Erysipelotrichaceae bacterium]